MASLFDGLQAYSLEQYQNAANYQNVITGTNSSTSTSLYGGYIGQPSLYDQLNSHGLVAQQLAPAKPKRSCEGCGATEGETHVDGCEVERDRCACHTERASKFHSAIEMLRREITAWHGNVLERCPA